MQIYMVGGAVRDKLLGLHPGDNDYVVVGSTPEAMLALIEWPERLGAQGWPEALSLGISGQGDARVLTAEVPAAWEARWPLR